jgi:Peptidase S24-like
VIEATPTMDPRDLARLALLETWRRDGAEAWIEATGNSMLPLIQPGDRLRVAFGEQDARRGDVIIFRHGGMVVAHRVVGSRQRDGVRRLIAKGDHEPLATEDVGPADLLGVVRAVDRGAAGGHSTRGLGGISAGVTARISRIGGSLARASARGTSPITALPIAGAAFVARSALSLWTSLLASPRKVESLGKGGEKP